VKWTRLVTLRERRRSSREERATIGKWLELADEALRRRKAQPIRSSVGVPARIPDLRCE
jgi:hypothetical protein